MKSSKITNVYLFSFILSTLLVDLGFQVGIAEAIVGGRLANADEFKALVSIWTNGHHVCSGAMITPLHALAAAHCAIGANNRFKDSEFSIRAATINVNTNSGITVIVDTIYIPRSYERDAIAPGVGYNNEEDDICIFRLKQQLNIRREVRVLRLPRKINGEYQAYHLESVKFFGFGASRRNIWIGRDGENIENCGENCGKLKVLQTNTLTRADCINHYGLLDYRHICAKTDSPTGNPTGTCHGDAGGPLVFNRDTVIGVLAQNTATCNETIRASLFTRVSTNIHIISQAIEDMDNQLGDSVYDNVRVADWIYRNNIYSMIERT